MKIHEEPPARKNSPSFTPVSTMESRKLLEREKVNKAKLAYFMLKFTKLTHNLTKSIFDIISKHFFSIKMYTKWSVNKLFDS